jgi:hypothetical protein
VLAEELRQKIASESENLKSLKMDADRYGRCLVGAVKNLNVAVQENTLAVFRQRYLVAKYGLPKGL